MLSAQGYADAEAIRKGDAFLGAIPGAEAFFGEGKFYVAFYGTPSRGRKWTVQFGGHHLAIHMTFSGETVANTPYFLGIEPLSFTQDGRRYEPWPTRPRRSSAQRSRCGPPSGPRPSWTSASTTSWSGRSATASSRSRRA